MQTSRLSLQPQYDPNKGGTARLLGFQVTNQVTIRIRDIDSLPAILDRAIAAGANEMSGIEFMVSEQSKLLDQARDDADRRRPAQGRSFMPRRPAPRSARWLSITEEGASPPVPPDVQRCRPCAPRSRSPRANRCCAPSVTVSFELKN